MWPFTRRKPDPLERPDEELYDIGDPEGALQRATLDNGRATEIARRIAELRMESREHDQRNHWKETLLRAIRS